MEDIDYFSCKPSHIKIAHKRYKFGMVTRSGATLRRNTGTKNHIFHGGCHRNGAAILKHISSTDQWKPKQVQESFDIDDGGMLSSKSFSKVSSRRGKGVLSPIAGKGHWNGDVTYSMNKKQRWLLPDMLKNEVHKEMHQQNNPLLENIDLTVIEREIGTNGNLWMFYSLGQIPDTVSVTTSVKSCNKEDPMPHCRKSKRRKYGWSTDMMGLSQKKDCDTDEVPNLFEENLKPQVTYEICRPRSPGRYPNFVEQPDYRYEEYRKSRTNAKRELLSLYQDWQDNQEQSTPRTSQETEDDVTMTSRRCSITSFSVSSWLFNTTKKTNYTRTRKRRRCGSSKAINRTASSMKDRVVYEPAIQKESGLQNSVLTNGEAESYSERIRKSEEKRSMEVNMSLTSLKELENLFEEPLEQDSKPKEFCKVDVLRGKSLPLKYTFQLTKQLATNSGSDRNKPARCCFTLEVIDGRNRCLNEQNCYTESNLCLCFDNVRTRLKTIILSEDDHYQMVADEWSKNLKEQLDQGHPKGFSFEHVINMAEESLQTAAEANTFTEEQSPKPEATVPRFSSYTRDVIGAAALLLGFSTNQIAKKELANQFNKSHLSDVVETNHSSMTTVTSPDYCRICFEMLSDETGDDCRASAMAACNHWFCTDCWRGHLCSVTCNALASPAQCPGFGCEVKVDDATMMTLLPGHVIMTYRKRLVSNAMKRSEKYHDCPACNDSIKVNFRKSLKATKNNIPLSCACGARWCIGCKGEPHWPATCASAALYWEEVQKESKARYRNAITSVSGKKCPDCHEPIEKDGGCQMMTCFCGSTFCWVCMRPASECWYRCTGEGNSNLETWDISSSSSSFISGVREAIVFSNRYHSLREHNLRVGFCHATALKWAAHHCPEASFDEIVAKTKQFESKLGECLLFCDSLYHIMQYLTICIATRQPQSKYHRAKLNRFLARLKMAAASIEHIIFHWNPKYHHRMSPLQRAQKQMESAKCLVMFLQSFVRRCEIR